MLGVQVHRLYPSWKNKFDISQLKELKQKNKIGFIAFIITKPNVYIARRIKDILVGAFDGNALSHYILGKFWFVYSSQNWIFLWMIQVRGIWCLAFIRPVFSVGAIVKSNWNKKCKNKNKKRDILLGQNWCNAMCLSPQP